MKPNQSGRRVPLLRRLFQRDDLLSAHIQDPERDHMGLKNFFP